MEHVELFKFSEQFPAEFKAAESFHAFAYALDASKPGPGRLLQHIADKYPDAWELDFQTIKEHGFVGGRLLMPHARKVSDLFADVSLYEYQSGGLYRDQINYVRAGAAFISTHRAPGFAYFGHLGATYDRGERGDSRRVRSGTQYLTAAKPTPAVVEAFGSGCGAGEWDLATFEVVRRASGALLVVARCNNGFGSRWLALLDPGETAMSMLGEHERGEIAAEEARKAEAWESAQ